MAIAGYDIVVQPKESVRLSGFQSRDEDPQTLTFKWTMVTIYPHAIIEVRKATLIPDLLLPYLISNFAKCPHTLF